MEAGSIASGTGSGSGRHPGTGAPTAPNGEGSGTGAQGNMPTPGSSFNQIKSLIIKSAEIVDAYYEQINRRLESVYVANSEFGTYKQEVAGEFTETAERLDGLFTNVQSIAGELNQVIAVSANIRAGLLYEVGTDGDPLAPELSEGTPVYGVEVGQETERDGEVVFDRFARFTAYGMVLYDGGGNISAYITNRQLRIPNAVIEGTLTRGGFVETVYADGSSVERWVKT